jgi:hypothetical protein
VTAPTTTDAPGNTPVAPTPPPPDIGWGRAVLSSILIVAIGVLGCVYLPNMVVNGFQSLSPDTRTDIAAAICIVVLLVLAWCLRRAQARGLI